MAKYVIVYGDKGLGVHNAGSLFEWAASTHKKEIMQNKFPGVPMLPNNAAVEMFHISSVPDLINDIASGEISYLAYFGHSWDSYLFIGENPTEGSNLGAVSAQTVAPVTDIPKDKFLKNSQIRLFGCRAGFGPAPIALQLHNHLGVEVFAYENTGGSLFTQDQKLGHGERAVTQNDMNFKAFKKASNTWLVPINGTPSFRRFA